MKKHILVIAQYFYPEQFRINDICTEWVNRGYKVTVITGIPNYPQGEYYKGYGLFKKRKETYNGIEIIRIPLVARGNNSIMLSLNYLSFVISGFFWKTFTKIKADYVYIYEVSPMTQALPGVWYAKKRKIPCYLYVTDLWPENVEIVTGIKNKAVLNTIGAMVDYIYKHSDKIFTSSKNFIKSINNRGVPIEKLEFWPQYAEDFYTPVDKETVRVPEIPKDNKFNIIFAGNIGTAQGLGILPEVARLLKKQEINVRFNIVGDGRFKDKLMGLVNTYEVTEMFNFIQKQPATRIPDFMSVCDATLISLSKNKVFSMTIPAKTQSCLACGLPIIVSADGEIQDVINESGAGVCSDAGDVQTLASNIQHLVFKTPAEIKQMSDNAIQYSKLNFNKNKLLDSMDRWFEMSK
ncbi:putative glycosyl transferase [Jeotgalicoccus aerolatus]|uniref:Glycosyltransferase involved in cell wall biosynthesis n=1 Tax=Jeotgalicoccus aerolatus TaxID=709510 RepID=A0ABS4HLU9_9STAP|nr:glycosyltransferase family 4 protein [Jeotgalicoccus aerolatus]MBP1951905.1 glycosyltransferase involved in cell wall biosynthesis [Jeotgalicoccus aerolatus]GGD93831.1 glycosyltransferase WbuB [Jeotgalicoccus aerolatus]CAD2074887.1 putative glycosyl transferase [Jeotgalicoccus aerolatus]